jgi:hypothetical protein
MAGDHPLDSLSKDDLLVLFEWANRFCDTENLAFTHPAEAVVIDKIAGKLEREMAEPFKDDYLELLEGARARVLASFVERMGKDTWIHRQPMNPT